MNGQASNDVEKEQVWGEVGCGKLMKRQLDGSCVGLGWWKQDLTGWWIGGCRRRVGSRGRAGKSCGRRSCRKRESTLHR